MDNSQLNTSESENPEQAATDWHSIRSTHKPVVLICQQCGDKFEVKWTAAKKGAKYCSDTCSRIGRRGRKLAPRVYTKTKKICPFCKEEFEVTHGNRRIRKYCSDDCKKAASNTPGVMPVHPGFIDLTGRERNLWRVLGYSHKSRSGHHIWNVECQCPLKTKTKMSGHSFTDGSSKRCALPGCNDDKERPISKRCTKCDGIFPYTEEYFVKKAGFRWKLSPQCKECYYKDALIRHKVWRDRVRYQVLSYYSGDGMPRCVCCPPGSEMAVTYEFLTLDHVNNDGNEERKTVNQQSLFGRLVRLGFPPGYQTLCMSCNMAKATNKECPHRKREREFPEYCI